jgi:hypothetical protein
MRCGLAMKIGYRDIYWIARPEPYYKSLHKSVLNSSVINILTHLFIPPILLIVVLAEKSNKEATTILTHQYTDLKKAPKSIAAA